MKPVVGFDGTPGGWAAVIFDGNDLNILRVPSLQLFFLRNSEFENVAIDIPIGLVNIYEVGGRICDREARAILGKRASSVFPAPVHSVLDATSYAEACAISRSSGPANRSLTKQTFHILPKIKEVDNLLRDYSKLRKIVREVHPEVSFRELAGAPMTHSKRKRAGREERRRALNGVFPQFEAIEAIGRSQNLPSEDIIDATIACWSAYRMATGKGRRIPDRAVADSTGLEMAIWV